jgi:hypothetical protein
VHGSNRAQFTEPLGWGLGSAFEGDVPLLKGVSCEFLESFRWCVDAA